MFKVLLSKGVRLGLAVAFGFSLMVAFAGAAQAANTYEVNSTADPGDGTCDATECTLREAIGAANKDPGSKITFNISVGCNVATSVCTIQPLTALPAIIASVTINGYSQTGSKEAMNNAVAILKIELDGTKISFNTSNAMLDFIGNSGGSQVRGLVINRAPTPAAGIRLMTDGNTVAGNFIGTDVAGLNVLANGGVGIGIGGNSNFVGGTSAADRNVISGNADGIGISGSSNNIWGNYIGTDAAGVKLLGNRRNGVYISNGTLNTVGGADPSKRNVISGNGNRGVDIENFSSKSSVVGNFIGTQADGKTALGNQWDGIFIIDSDNNIVGKDTTGNGAGNTIAFNTKGVTVVSSGTSNTILGNSIFANTGTEIPDPGIGIDLWKLSDFPGVTKNDVPPQSDPPDQDSGPNGLQNFPVLTPATPTKIQGTLQSTPDKDFIVEFFRNPSCNGSGYGEGKEWLAQIPVHTSATGTISFQLGGVQVGQVITATATRKDDGSTSEFSKCLTVSDAVYVNSTTDDNTCYENGTDICTLRGAINFANNDADLTKIYFNITGSCPHTISLQSALPAIIHPVIIDGYTDKDAKQNTLPNDDNAILCIQVQGTTAWFGLEIDTGGGGSTVQGLVLNKFASAFLLNGSSKNTIRGNFIGTDPSGLNVGGNNNGIYLPNGSSTNVIGVSDEDIKNGTAPAARNLISGNKGSGVIFASTSNGNLVRGNFIGTNRHGTTALSNLAMGVVINDVANNVVGGTQPEFRNVISGNGEDGVDILNANATGNKIQGNLIGTDVTGKFDLGNKGNGVRIENGSGGNTIGDPTAPAGTCSAGCNVIAFNGGLGGSDGVFIKVNTPASTNNAIIGNSIYSNTGLGINLQGGNEPGALFGVSLNDDKDTDDGANHFQNFPVIFSATSRTLTSKTNVKGTLNSTPGKKFRLDFYASAKCDSTSYGEGQTFLGSAMTDTTDGNGNVSFDFDLSTTGFTGQFATATATDLDNNMSPTNTSEFSLCAEILPDADGDGIVDNVDVAPSDPANNSFSDTINNLGGTTNGEIVERGSDRFWLIKDEPDDPNTPAWIEGVHVFVGPGISINPSFKSTQTSCNPSTTVDNIPLGGSDYVFSCASTILQVRHGSARASTTVNGLTVRVDVPTNGGVRYKLADGGGVQVINVGATALNVTSGDKTFTVDVGKDQTFYNDTTPPEASIEFDSVGKDISVFGRDSGSGVAPGPVAVDSVSGDLRTYKVADLAGNKLVLVEKVKKDGKEIKATLVSLQYNEAVKTPPANQQSFEWSTDKDGSIKELQQKMEVGTGATRQVVEAKFDSKKNQTVIDRNVRPGLVLIHLDTNKGALAIGSDSLNTKMMKDSSVAQFQLSSSGGISISTSGSADAPVALGYGRIQPDAGSVTPNGLAIVSLRQRGVLVSETSIPASPLIQNGRIYAEINGAINTGVAIANPNDEDALVTFYFTDATGRNFGNGSTVIPANGQVARYLNEPPFNGGSSVSGTFTFTSSIPVGAIGMRGLTNERSELLITTLPVASVSAVSSKPVFLPDFADGGGWTTQIVLVNPTDDVLTGSAEFFGTGSANSAAQPVNVTVSDQTGSSFSYSIPARSSVRLATSGRSSSIQVGSVRITPAANSSAPSGMVIVSSRSADGVTITEAGVPAIPTSSAFRLYAEASGTFGQPGSIQAGVAVANASSKPVPVTLTLSLLDGTPTGLTSTVTVPGNGQTALFLNQVPGFESLSLPSQGVLRIATNSASGISVVGLRGHYNERNEFLISAMPPADETSPGSTAELIFPHVADGGGYSTQFVLFSPTQQSAGTLTFFSQSAEPLSLPLR